jgi:hypothetical protein
MAMLIVHTGFLRRAMQHERAGEVSRVAHA